MRTLSSWFSTSFVFLLVDFQDAAASIQKLRRWQDSERWHPHWGPHGYQSAGNVSDSSTVTSRATGVPTSTVTSNIFSSTSVTSPLVPYVANMPTSLTITTYASSSMSMVARVLAPIPSTASSPAAAMGNSTFLAYAHGAISYMQTMYSSGGLWPPAGWWNSANALTLLLDLRAVDSSSFLTSITDGPSGVFSTTLLKAPSDLSNGLMNGDGYLDDEGWWTLAAIKAYDVTGNDTWLTAANRTFSDIVANGLNNVPCGGVYWDKPPAASGTNRPDSVIATALFIDAAAQLAIRYPAQKDYYVSLANTQLEWLLAPALFIDNIIKGDGLHGSPCTSNGAILSYQEGVTIGALVSLNKATGNATYLATAMSIANAIIKPSSPLTDANSILFDPYPSFMGGDTAQFKGIFMRNLVLLHQTSPSSDIVGFLRTNAESIWTKDRSGDGKDQIGCLWAGPWNTGSDPSTAAAAHISGTMALVAAAVVS